MYKMFLHNDASGTRFFVICICVCVCVHSVEPLEQQADLQRVQQSIKEYLVAGMPKTNCVSPKWNKKVGTCCIAYLTHCVQVHRSENLKEFSELRTQYIMCSIKG